MAADSTKSDFLCDRLYGQLVGLRGKTASAMRSWRFNHEKATLERGLAGIIETANSHRAKGLPKGSPAYTLLRETADARIQVFATKWSVDVATIAAQAPALADLDELCVTGKQIPAGLKLLAVLLGIILSLVLLGAASGLVHAGHDWVIHFVAR